MVNLRSVVIAFATAVVLSDVVSGFMLHSEPNTYRPGDAVRVDVNALTSTQTLLPMDFYSVPTCEPWVMARRTPSLGGTLSGEDVRTSAFRIEMGINATCRVLCPTLQLTAADRAVLGDRIEQGYRAHILVDGLPAAELSDPPIRAGYPLGETASQSPRGLTMVYNHLAFMIGYERVPLSENEFRVVSVSVYPSSLQLPNEAACEGTAHFNRPATSQTVLDSALLYTYSVVWTESSSVRWTNRWDAYINGVAANNRVRCLSIVNSVAAILVMGGVIGILLIRILKTDVMKKNDSEVCQGGDGAWLLLYGDVFRPPTNPTLLVVGVATGAQLLGGGVCVLCLGCMGFLGADAPGALLSVTIIVCLLWGWIGGYVAARLLTMMRREAWKPILLCAASPAVPFATYLVPLSIQTTHHATNAVSSGAITTLLVLWGLGSALCVVGAAIGFRQPRIVLPFRPNLIPRPIPPQRWWMPMLPGFAIMVFSAAYIELIFMFGAMFACTTYYAFGLGAVVLVLVCVTSGQVSIMATYFRLRHEDHRWWAHAFTVPGTCGPSVLCFAVYYSQLAPRTDAGVAILLGYVTIIATVITVITGSVGFFASLWFTKKIYSALPLDDNRWGTSDDECRIKDVPTLSDLFGGMPWVDRALQHVLPSLGPECQKGKMIPVV